MAFNLVMLDVVFQRPAKSAEVKRQLKLPEKLRDLSFWREARTHVISRHELTTVNIRCGTGYNATELVRHLLARVIARNARREDRYVYAIAHFERDDDTEFFKTIMPRTPITMALRGL